MTKENKYFSLLKAFFTATWILQAWKKLAISCLLLFGVHNYAYTILGACDFTYDQSSYCQNGTNPLPNIVTSDGTWSEASNNVVFVDPTTGEINLAGSNLGGPYDIIYESLSACRRLPAFLRFHFLHQENFHRPCLT